VVKNARLVNYSKARLKMNRQHVLRAIVFSCSVLVATAVQTQAPAAKPVAPAVPALPSDANQYARQALQQELSEQDRDHTFWRYHIHRENKTYNYDRDVIQTNQGEISRTFLWKGQRLTPELRGHDEGRIHELLNDKAVLAKHVKREKDGVEMMRKMLAAGPDAFNFQYDGEEAGLVRLRFTPNPHYDPSSPELKIFRSLAGKLWIDRASSRLARVEGVLFEDASFPLGPRGRLNKGGTVKIVRQDMGSGHWDFVSLDVNAPAHGLIFASISFKEHQTFSNYSRVPDLTLFQAYELLKKDSDDAVPTDSH
jgi:hypothetical protein